MILALTLSADRMMSVFSYMSFARSARVMLPYRSSAAATMPLYTAKSEVKLALKSWLYSAVI